MMTVLGFDSCIGRPKRCGQHESTITEILSDPIVKALMLADRVDPEELEGQLRSTAQEISSSSYRFAAPAGSSFKSNSRGHTKGQTAVGSRQGYAAASARSAPPIRADLIYDGDRGQTQPANKRDSAGNW